MIYLVCGDEYMITIGEKIKKIRKSKNISQDKLAELLIVSDKTISSWECDRTVPDINMLIKISSALDYNFYDFINDNEMKMSNIEYGIKLKFDYLEYNKLLKSMSSNTKYINQKDIYYISKYEEFNDKWLRIRCENNKYHLSLKKKEDDNCFNKNEVVFDDLNSMKIILNNIGLTEYGIIDKNRITIIYKDKFSISFDNVKGIGYFVEIKNISDCDDIKTKIKEIYELLGELNIDIKYINTKRYFDYL